MKRFFKRTNLLVALIALVAVVSVVFFVCARINQQASAKENPPQDIPRHLVYRHYLDFAPYITEADAQGRGHRHQPPEVRWLS